VTSDGECTDLRREYDALEARIAEYENAITWDTTCLNCSQLLDRSIFDHERAERAEAALRELRGI
jgi:hypothetical protein